MKQMYDNLKALTQKNEMFFSSIQTTPSGVPVEIFSYHVASYSDWLEPDAIECRGIMFDITDKQNPVILSRPMEKFFNLGEVSGDINTLAERLIEQGRLSRDVYEKAKEKYNQTTS